MAPAAQPRGVRITEGYLDAELQATPEWQCEDSSYLPFGVTGALDPVHFALQAAAGCSARENAGKAPAHLLDVTDTFDVSAAKFYDAQTGKLLAAGVRSN